MTGRKRTQSISCGTKSRAILVPRIVTTGAHNDLRFGTDEPVYTNLLPGFACHRELLAMTYAAIPPAAVLKAATINGARDISFVIKDGIAYDPAELLQSAEGKIGPAGPDDHANWELGIRPLREDRSQ